MREVLQVEPAVQRRQGLSGDVGEDRELQQVDMEMQQVELVAAPTHFMQHRQVRGDV